MPSKTKLQEFQALTVKVALDAAERNGWCDEVKNILKDELGLGHLLPPEYRIDRLATGRKTDKWREWDHYDNAPDAKDAAVQARTFAIMPDPYGSNRKYEYVNVLVQEGTNLEATVERAKREIEAAFKKYSATKKPAKVPEYPKFRVVMLQGGKEDVIFTPEEIDEEAVQQD